jgi:hypothetical protein
MLKYQVGGDDGHSIFGLWSKNQPLTGYLYLGERYKK